MLWHCDTDYFQLDNLHCLLFQPQEKPEPVLKIETVSDELGKYLYIDYVWCIYNIVSPEVSSLWQIIIIYRLSLHDLCVKSSMLPSCFHSCCVGTNEFGSQDVLSGGMPWICLKVTLSVRNLFCLLVPVYFSLLSTSNWSLYKYSIEDKIM
jgi:hypothetical protein